MKLSSFIAEAQERLALAGIDNPQLDARLLIAHALGVDRAALLTQGEHPLTEEELAKIEPLIARREKREPVARILGMREFWGLPFGLNEATLEPRPDSETLIETALGLVPLRHSRENGMPACAGTTEKKTPLRLLDLGTGTGCLLLALLHEWPEATGLGIDLSPRAVEQAQANAQRLGLWPRASFRQGNWLEGIEETFDLIISNPPYIKAEEIRDLAPEVRLFDPPAALDGGEDGLSAYRHLIPRLPALLNPGGALLFEVGLHQAAPVCAFMREAGLTDLSVRRDLAGIERCVTGRKAR